MISLVLGGARSGKSRYAESLAIKNGKPKLYLATCEHLDDEMEERIARHRRERAEDGWKTIEEPLKIAGIISDQRYQNYVILVDCLSVWLGNLIHYDYNIEDERDYLLDHLAMTHADVILVANEVGLGIVPETKLGRQFRDAAGILNQQIAHVADNVTFMAAGCPLVMKG